MKKRATLCVCAAVCLVFFSACGDAKITVTQTETARTQTQTTNTIESTKPAITQPKSTQPKPAITQPKSTQPKASTAPQLQSVKITITEGSSFYAIAKKLESSGICSAQAFYDTAQNYQVQSFHVPRGGGRCYNMEGFLFPDTYEFYQNSDPMEVLRRMLNNYAAKSGMPDYDTLVLASIIERETRSAEHMAMVSSVLHNRLEAGMKLEADSTRSYVNNNITANPLVKDADQYAALYNTYKCAALPVGPIGNPGKRAIEAAKNPANSTYLYFFFGDDNTNHYSRTFDEHKAQMAQYGVNYG
ncbi:MAG: endolytic transglycosylase MltG [Oscillospiraceae bacterium]|nr:endolytic transglycosylase MltG [Oscillospiraceae bacterium]